MNKPSYGLNSTLIKKGNSVREDVWKADGKYGAAIKANHCLVGASKGFHERTNSNYKVISLLIKYYVDG